MNSTQINAIINKTSGDIASTISGVIHFLGIHWQIITIFALIVVIIALTMRHRQELEQVWEEFESADYQNQRIAVLRAEILKLSSQLSAKGINCQQNEGKND